MTQLRASIVDLGRDFDGRCALCRDPINPGQHYRILPVVPNGAPHAVVHAAPQGDAIPCREVDGAQ